MKALRSNWIVLVTAAVLVGLDQLFKWLAIENLSGIATFPLLDGIFHLTYVENRGAAVGIMKGWGIALIILTTVVLAGLVWLLLKGKFKHPFLLVAITLFIGGGVGNLIDRVFRQFVVDYLDFRLINFAVFNFADCFIVIGTIFLCIYVLFLSDKEKKEEETAEEAVSGEEA